MPFAIGQVQDAGLIFLSRMASSIADGFDKHADGTDEELLLKRKAMISTAIVTLGLCTACLGAILIVVGRARLAKFVAYLPVPVISGYLAFIGFFCIEAGLSLCTSKAVTGWSDMVEIAMDSHDVILCIPGLLAGLLLCIVSRKAEGETTLPAVMMGIPLLFYVCVSVGGWTLDDARDFGWVGPNSPHPGSIGGLIDLIDFNAVDWSLFPQQIPVFFSMVFVVAFSSCLDVAAIEMDVGKPLDVDSELATVGWSNLISGMLGGFTGSYIFSQTIFTCRSGCHSKGVGAVVAIAELAVVFVQVDLLAWIPLFFFAATLIFIGFDLILEWLFDVRHKLDFSEYLVVLFTFGAIECLGLDEGLLWGVLSAALQFLYHYSQQSQVAVVNRQSMVLRTAAASAMIHRQYKRGVIATLEIRGSLFFGSSLRILEEVKTVLNGQPHTMVSMTSPSPIGTNSSRFNQSKASMDKASSSQETEPSFLTKLFGGGSQNNETKPLMNNERMVKKKQRNIPPPPPSPLSIQPSSASASPIQYIISSPNRGQSRHRGASETDFTESSMSESMTKRQAGGGGAWNAKRGSFIPMSPARAFGNSSTPSNTGFPSHQLLAGPVSNSTLLSLNGELNDSDEQRILKKNNDNNEDGDEDGGSSNKYKLASSWDGSRLMKNDFFTNLKSQANQSTAEGSVYGSVASYFEPSTRTTMTDESSFELTTPQLVSDLPSRVGGGKEGKRNYSSGLQNELTLSSMNSEVERVIPIDGPSTGGGGENMMEVDDELKKRHSNAFLSNENRMTELELGVANDTVQGGGVTSDVVLVRPRYLVLDFTHVSSVDATAVHSCFGPVGRLTQSLEVKLVYAGCQYAVESQLRLHGAFAGDHIRIFPTVNRALDWCESAIIARARHKLDQSRNPSRKSLSSSSSKPKQDISTRSSGNESLTNRGEMDQIPYPSAPLTPVSLSHNKTKTVSRTSPRSNVKSSDNVLKVGTLLRQWLELRPEVPPAQVRSWLFLGGAHHACDKGLLERFDIGYVLNVADDINNFFENETLTAPAIASTSTSTSDHNTIVIGVDATPSRLSSDGTTPTMTTTTRQRKLKYCNLKVSDYGQDEGISRCFPEAITFAKLAYEGFKQGKGKMLVHCRFGMNRSPTVVTAILMELELLSLAKSWKSLKTLCHSAYPQVDNRKQLVSYEMKRLKEKTKSLYYKQNPTKLNHKDKKEKNLSSLNKKLVFIDTKNPEELDKEDEDDEDEELANMLARVTGSMTDEDFKSHGMDDAEHLSVYCRTESFKRNEMIFRFGDHADELYLLLGGRVDLVDGDGTVTLSLTPGNVFGFVDSQLGKPRGKSAYAKGRLGSNNNNNSGLDTDGGGDDDDVVVHVAAISMASLERMSVDHPSIAIKLMKVLLRQSSIELSNTLY